MIDDKEFMPPNEQDMMLTDVTSDILREEVAKRLGVSYLEEAEELTQGQEVAAFSPSIGHDERD